MKKLITTFCFLLAVSFTAQQAQAQVNFGIRGGVNFATFNDVAEEDVNLGTSAGLLAGVYFQFPIENSPIVIQPELLYSQKGYENEIEEGTVIQNLNYIEIPVLVKFNYVLDGDLTPYVTAGPYVGFLVGSSSELNGEELPEEDIFNDFDFGVAVGAGVDYHCFNFGVRYSVGLTTVVDVEGEDLSAKNGVFSIVAGVTIPPNFFD